MKLLRVLKSLGHTEVLETEDGIPLLKISTPRFTIMVTRENIFHIDWEKTVKGNAYETHTFGVNQGTGLVLTTILTDMGFIVDAKEQADILSISNGTNFAKITFNLQTLEVCVTDTKKHTYCLVL